MWDLIVSVPDHCLSFYFASVEHFEKWVSSVFLFRSGRGMFEIGN